MYAKRTTIKTRIVSCFLLQLLTVIITPLWALLLESKSLAFWLTCGGLFFLGILAGILNASVLGLAALFPRVFTRAALTGAGCAGMLVAIIRVLTKAALHPGISSLVYFIVTALAILVCLILYLLLPRIPFARHYMDREFHGNDTEASAEILSDDDDDMAAMQTVDAHPTLKRIGDVPSL